MLQAREASHLHPFEPIREEYTGGGVDASLHPKERAEKLSRNSTIPEMIVCLQNGTITRSRCRDNSSFS